MLQHIHLLLQFQVVLFLAVQFAVLYLQGAALRRHGHRCFQYLVAATVCGICALFASGALLFCTPTEALYVWSYVLGFLFGIAQGSLGLIGIVLLFRDYRRLADHFSSTSTTPIPK